MLNHYRKSVLKDRLELLASNNRSQGTEEIDYAFLSNHQKRLDPKLVDAGYLEPEEQSRINKYKIYVCLAGMLVGIGLSFYFNHKPLALVVGAVLGLYFALVAWILWLRAKSRDVVRSAYFDLPLILEELILLIESGLGLFPALEKVCSYESDSFKGGDPGVCRKSFKKAFSLAVHGMPVSQAFALVSKSATCVPLKQVLIHLDVSASIGGELLTSLRALSDQVHREWKMQVETRVKRLENMVVFPVFLAVMGLLLLTSAVPLVPVFEFMSSMKNGANSSSLDGTSLLKNGDTLK